VSTGNSVTALAVETGAATAKRADLQPSCRPNQRWLWLGYHLKQISMASTRTLLLPLVAIIIGTFMVILDTTVVNVALPTLGRVFATDLSVLQWVIGAYLLAQAAVIPLSGWLSDRFGAKRVYLTSLVLFTFGSALCGFAQSGEMLIGTRVLQGLGGGMLMPIGMAVLYRLTPPDRRGAVFGLFGLPVMVAPALGPLLSGYLLEFADWRLIFLINVPIGALALLFGVRALPSIAAGRAAGALDTLGIILGPLAFVSLSFGISQSTQVGWTAAPTLAGIGVGLLALLLFVWRELVTTDPVLELRVFASRDFTLAILTQWAGFGAMFGTFFLVPLFLQQVRGYGSFETGLFTLPQAVASGVFMQVSGRAFDRFGARPPVLLGTSLIIGAMWLMSQLSGSTTGEDLRLPLILMGAGMGSMMMALNTHMLNTAPRELVGRVTSLTSAMQNVVGSLAIATFATILQARLPFHISEAGIAAGGQPSPAMLADAAAFAFGDVYRTALMIVVVAWLLVWTLRRPQPAGAVIVGRRHAENDQPRASVEREPLLVGD
jgi:EmrB/QacA subfamily drug resistance transporter